MIFDGFVIIDPLATITEKVRIGAALYQKRHNGQRPNLCQIHPSQAKQEFIIDGIRVQPVSCCLPNDFLFTLTEITQLPLLVG